MQDAYVNAFRSVVKETQATTGFELPEPIECYVVMLLAHYMDRPDFLPEKSFAHAYLKLRKPAGHSAKELGDACLIVCGAFQTYGTHMGLTKKYFQDIGISSYDMIAHNLNYTLFSMLSQHFVFVSEFIDRVVTPPPVQYKGLFR